MDCSPRGSSVHGILQAKIREWVAVPFSRGFSQPRNQTWISCIAGRLFTNWATRETPPCTVGDAKSSESNVRNNGGSSFFFFFFLETLNKVDTIWRRRNVWAKSGHLWHSGTWASFLSIFLKQHLPVDRLSHRFRTSHQLFRFSSLKYDDWRSWKWTRKNKIASRKIDLRRNQWHRKHKRTWFYFSLMTNLFKILGL